MGYFKISHSKIRIALICKILTFNNFCSNIYIQSKYTYFKEKIITLEKNSICVIMTHIKYHESKRRYFIYGNQDV